MDRHGLPMHGLRQASGHTENYGNASGLYNEIFYDRRDGTVWTVLQCSLGQNSWTQYEDPSIIKICNTSRHCTMQEIADMIDRRVFEITVQ